MRAWKHLHITGASGCGVTTLGAALAGRLGQRHLDTDDFYWQPTEPPFQRARARGARLALLREAMAGAARGWVLSGSLDDWGNALIPLFDAVIFVRAPTELRLARLAWRERARRGDAIAPGGPEHDHYADFMAYAAAYDSGIFTGVLTGRYLARHETWLARLPCPVLRLDGSLPTSRLVDMVLSAFGDETR